MKRLTAVVAGMLVLLLAAPVMAGTVGGPCLQMGQLEVAYDMNWVERDMTLKSVTNNNSTIGLDNAEVHTLSHLAKLTYGFSDMFEAHVGLGATKLNGFIEEAPPADILNPMSNVINGFDRPTFTWEIGAKATAPHVFQMVDISLGGQYSATNFKDLDSNILANGTANAAMDFDLREWQVDLIASVDYGQFVPYAGIRYSDMQTTMNLRPTNANPGWAAFDIEYEAARNWGPVVGVDVDFNYLVSGYLEARFVDETGVSGGLNVKF